MTNLEQARRTGTREQDSRPPRTAAEDELDLLNVWAAVGRWRYVAAALVVLGVVAGIALGLRARPVYESSAVVQIGRVGRLGRIQPAAELVQQLRQTYGIGDPARHAGATPYVHHVEELSEGSILITARGFAPQDVRAFLKAELEKTLTEHTSIFEEVVKRKMEARDALVGRITDIQTQAQVLGERADLVMPRNAAVGAVLTQDRTRLTTELSNLEERLSELELELSRVSTAPTRVTREPAEPEAPVSRGLAYFTMLGAAAGVVLAGLAVLMLEHLPREGPR